MKCYLRLMLLGFIQSTCTIPEPDVTNVRKSVQEAKSRPEISGMWTSTETRTPSGTQQTSLDILSPLPGRPPASKPDIIADTLSIIIAAKQVGVNLTVETCVHYLALNWSQIPNGCPEWKCVPPIRDEANRQRLWDTVVDGTIDCAVSDHSPCGGAQARRYRW